MQFYYCFGFFHKSKKFSFLILFRCFETGQEQTSKIVFRLLQNKLQLKIIQEHVYVQYIYIMYTYKYKFTYIYCKQTRILYTYACTDTYTLPTIALHTYVHHLSLLGCTPTTTLKYTYQAVIKVHGQNQLTYESNKRGPFLLLFL